jgi:dTDP-4-dehydrorhamnose reductase
MKQKILVLGAQGMLGHKIICQLAFFPNFDIYGTVTGQEEVRKSLPFDLGKNLIINFNAEDQELLERIFVDINPHIVINCIAKTKSLQISQNILSAININTRLPHLLARYCEQINARLIHISTDSLFEDQPGNYSEEAKVFASDSYSMTKFLGEVNYPGSITIRTSIIGHELKGKSGLVEWFLSQRNKVKGYTNVIYTGLPTIELANIIINFIIPNRSLQGIYHVGAEALSKYELLKLIGYYYKKDIQIEMDDHPRVNRSLSSIKFQKETGYSVPSWQNLISKMHQDYIILKNWY